MSPGIPEQAEVFDWFDERAIPVWSELELGARLTDQPIIAVTGTNGKTTTTEMIAAMLRADGREALACGNIGYPFAKAAREHHEVYVVEASSFQLRFTETFHPVVSVLLNIADDHLDWHGDLDAYRRAKARIYAQQSGDDVHVGVREDPSAAAMSARAGCRLVWTTLAQHADSEVGYRGPELLSRFGGEEVILGAPRSTHRGFRADAAAAAAAALAFGVDPDAVREAVATFAPMPHRGEQIGSWRGVAFIDDSKATNPHAALAALDGLQDVVLIAGGRTKGVDLAPLALGAEHVRAVVAIGEAAGQIEDLFSGIRPVHRAESLKEAVAQAADLAMDGGVVLLAPGCASQDMFKDYIERGERFAEAVRGLEDGT